jgi:hypothetical protein
MVMALGETRWNNEGGYHWVVSQPEMDSSFLYSWRWTGCGKYIEFYLQILSQFLKSPSDTLFWQLNNFFNFYIHW